MIYQVTLTKHEIRLIHRIMSSGIIAAPKEVRDGLRNKMADVTKQIAQLGSETIDGQVIRGNGDGLPSRALQTVARGFRRAAGDTSRQGESGQESVDNQA